MHGLFVGGTGIQGLGYLRYVSLRSRASRLGGDELGAPSFALRPSICILPSLEDSGTSAGGTSPHAVPANARDRRPNQGSRVNGLYATRRRAVVLVIMLFGILIGLSRSTGRHSLLDR